MSIEKGLGILHDIVRVKFVELSNSLRKQLKHVNDDFPVWIFVGYY